MHPRSRYHTPTEGSIGQKYEDRALVLHTLPAPKGKGPAGPEEPNAQDDGGKKEKEERLHPSLATIPRLVSVVEIIKREYLKTLDPVLAQGGSLSGLHQYNELGTLEDIYGQEEKEQTEEDRHAAIMHALQGKSQ